MGLVPISAVSVTLVLMEEGWTLSPLCSTRCYATLAKAHDESPAPHGQGLVRSKRVRTDFRVAADDHLWCRAQP